ncbi:MAG: transposase [Bacteroidetes bacterium]|nr:transposase [Bacteroidota bacterium]
MPRHMLKARGFEVGRKHVAPLMRRMGIKALYSKPNTSRSMCDLPVPVARPGDRACEPGLGDGPDLHPDGTRLRVPGRDH